MKISENLKEHLRGIERRLRKARIVVQGLQTAHDEIEMAIWDAEAIEAEQEKAATVAPTHPGERIIRALESAGRPLPISEIAHRAELTRQQVSDALRPLVSAGDVQRVRRGVYRRAR